MQINDIITPSTGAIDGTGIVATTPAAPNVLINGLPYAGRLLVVSNTCNLAVILSLNGKRFIEMPPAAATAAANNIQLGAHGLQLPAGAILGVYAASAPASGRIAVTVL